MLKSRTMAVAGTIAALSLADRADRLGVRRYATAASRARTASSGSTRGRRTRRTRATGRTARPQRASAIDQPPLTTMAGAAGGHHRPPRRPSHRPTPARATTPRLSRTDVRTHPPHDRRHHDDPAAGRRQRAGIALHTASPAATAAAARPRSRLQAAHPTSPRAGTKNMTENAPARRPLYRTVLSLAVAAIVAAWLPVHRSSTSPRSTTSPRHRSRR